MDEIRYTLLSDGSSDDALIPIMTWLLREHHVDCAIQATWADLRRLPSPPKTLTGRIRWSLDLYPCDLLFMHRDAEKQPREMRVAEIRAAIDGLSDSMPVPPVCVVPVRMQEAWFLHDEVALRFAAGNPKGKQPLHLPPIGQLEQLPDPKMVLYDTLRTASDLSGRRRSSLRVRRLVRQVAMFTEDFTPLRALPAFQALEEDVEDVAMSRGWDSSSKTIET